MILYAEHYPQGTRAITESGWVWEVGVLKWHCLGRRVNKLFEPCSALPLPMIQGSLTCFKEISMAYATVATEGEFCIRTANGMSDGGVVRDRGGSLYVVCGPDFIKFAGSTGERRYSQLDCVKVSGKVEINIP